MSCAHEPLTVVRSLKTTVVWCSRCGAIALPAWMVARATDVEGVRRLRAAGCAEEVRADFVWFAASTSS